MYISKSYEKPVVFLYNDTYSFYHKNVVLKLLRTDVMLLTSPNLYIIQAVCYAEKTDTRPILQAVKAWLQLADFRKTNCEFQIRFDKRTILIFMTFCKIDLEW